MAKQGQGRSTRIKERRLYQVLRQRLVMTKFWPGTFWYADLNAGCGWNHQLDVDCEGSPLVFLAAAEAAGRPFRAFFVEKDKVLASELEGRLPDWCRDHVTIWAMDNRHALPEILKAMDHAGGALGAFGCVYCDPNGYTAGYPHKELIAFAKATRRIDLLYSLNATAATRIEGASVRPELNMPDMPQLFAELLATRPFHLIAPPPRVVGDAFMQILLASSDKGLSGWKEWIPSDDPRAARVIASKRHTDPTQREMF